MKRYLCIMLILGFGVELFGQSSLHYYQSNMVSVLDANGKSLKNPFGGGIKFPTFTTMDLNFDTKPDLVVLDRADERILTFINEGGYDTIKYIYHPEYEDVFPVISNRFALLLDYNKDNKPDLFTFASPSGGGVMMYKNISFGSNILFEPYYPDPANQNNPEFIGSFYGNDYKTNILVKSSDIVSLRDADKDGDIDFFTYDDMGGAYLWYFKNFSQEINSNSDSFLLDMADSYWGYFMEADQSNIVKLGAINPFDYKDYKILMPRPLRHAGSTIFVNDMNGDDDLDLLVGDIGYPGIRYLINGKKQTNSKFDSIIDQDTFYPASKPVNIHNMPGVFYVDVNNDGVKDFLFSPMDETLIDGKNVDGLNQVWYYKNSGTENNPVLNFVKDNFIQEDMIDLGGSTVPDFFDYDGDGDKDMFVATRGNNIVTNYLADRIVLFENIGTALKPVFQKKDDNYLNIKAKGYKSLTVHLGDIDADGDKDLIMGNFDGRIIYYKNNPVNNSAVFSYVTDYFDSIDVGFYSVPVLADIDMDSIPELIIGSKGGTLTYLKNNGSSGNPDFSMVSDTFGGIIIPGGDHYCAPYIQDMDTNGHPDMILSYNFMDLQAGFVRSNVRLYKDIDLNPGKPFTAIDTLFYNITSKAAVKKYIGRKLRPSAADLDGDSLPDIVFGSDRGGLLFYGTNTSLSTQIIVTGKTTLCPGDTAILDAGSGFDSYLWNTGQKTQQIVVSAAGSYSCVVTKGSFSYKAYVSIQMHPGIVKADYTYTNNDLTVTFTALATNVDSVRWSFGDGYFSNDLNPVHAYSAPGNYSVCLEMFDNCGAKADTCKSILITGINDNSEQSVIIYPNPVEDLLHISSSIKYYGQKLSIKISDALGKEIIVKEVTMRDNQAIDLGNLSTGVYIFMISDKNGEILIKTKLFKQSE